MFQSYYDIENEVVIESKSAEATVNGWCQEIPVKDILDFEKKHKKEKWYKRFVKWLRGKK